MAIQGLGSPRRRVSSNVQVAAPSTSGVRREGAAKSQMFQNIAGLAGQLQERRYKAEADSQYNNAKDALIRDEHELKKKLDVQFKGTDYKGYDEKYSEGMKSIHDNLNKNLDNDAAYDKFDSAYNSYATQSAIKVQDANKINTAIFYKDLKKSNRKKNVEVVAKSGDPDQAALMYTTDVKALEEDEMNLYSVEEKSKEREALGDYGYTAVKANIIKGGTGLDIAESMMKGNSKNPQVNEMMNSLSAKQVLSLNKELANARKYGATKDKSKVVANANSAANLARTGDLTLEDGKAIMQDIDSSSLESADKKVLKNKIESAFTEKVLADEFVSGSDSYTNEIKKALEYDAGSDTGTLQEKSMRATRNKKILSAHAARVEEFNKKPVETMIKYDPTTKDLAAKALAGPENFKKFVDHVDSIYDQHGSQFRSYATPAMKELVTDIKDSMARGGEINEVAQTIASIQNLSGDKAYGVLIDSGLEEKYIPMADAGSALPRVLSIMDSKTNVPKAFLAKMKDTPHYRSLQSSNGAGYADSWAKVAGQNAIIKAEGSIGKADIESGWDILTQDHEVIDYGNTPISIPRHYTEEANGNTVVRMYDKNKVSEFIASNSTYMTEAKYKDLNIRLPRNPDGSIKGLLPDTVERSEDSVKHDEFLRRDYLNNIQTSGKWVVIEGNALELRIGNKVVLNKKGERIRKSLKDISNEAVEVYDATQIEQFGTGVL